MNEDDGLADNGIIRSDDFDLYLDVFHDLRYQSSGNFINPFSVRKFCLGVVS